MTAIAIPDPLPPTITLPREVLEFAITEHLKQFGESGLVARTWHWDPPRRRTRPDQPHELGGVRRRRAAIYGHARCRKHRRSVTALPCTVG